MSSEEDENFPILICITIQLRKIRQRTNTQLCINIYAGTIYKAALYIHTNLHVPMRGMHTMMQTYIDDASLTLN